ncbi:MAG: hypothetical protein KGD59_08705 [Candidatus Heimdallarchaeota archaeon]|nr:hypothetical protein [Candidatus Heimdallarchaeota archaeon]MBY8994616.1 hypothetical protein [Candidatus Heimdallarchaeota archaeon]
MKTKKFEQSMQKIKVKLEEEDKIRDSVIHQQRRIIRICSEAIKSIHRKEFDVADKKIAEAQEMLKEVLTMVKGLNSLECWRGLDDAAQELGEAIFISSMVRYDEIPSIEDCQITFTSYMLAASDAIGELRRFMMDSLRTNDFDNAQRAFDYMDYLYSELMTVDYTKMLVGPLRSKLDVARNLVNRTRSDLINAKQAFELKESMQNLSDKLDKVKKEK